MRRASASTIVPGRLAEAEDLWYDRHRWPSLVDGFGHVVKLEGELAGRRRAAAVAVAAQGRGRVQERVERLRGPPGQTLEVEDERCAARQRSRSRPLGDGTASRSLLEYELKEPGLAQPPRRRLFIRRALTDSLRRTLSRFANERRAEVDLR